MDLRSVLFRALVRPGRHEKSAGGWLPRYGAMFLQTGKTALRLLLHGGHRSFLRPSSVGLHRSIRAHRPGPQTQQ
ncbi:hypothetical protein RvY_03598-4 [Ramazzottius varieornatus]|uniref:Uncharacterized protein n=1 Tax=Ramazzottius varieornatus TaxID=947166 RepID=A0A1D1UNP0_RAMVA|nr:hypothetical protein RvY_03598-4 [Ramazzottius varieornatus]